MSYELPEAVKQEYVRIYGEIQKLKDGIQKMKAAGLNVTELELKLQSEEEKLNKIIKAFNISVPVKA